MEILSEEQTLIIEKSPKNAADAFKLLKADFDKRKKTLSKVVSTNSSMLTNTFNFCEAAFSKGSQEMLILVTELTVSTYASHFISRYGCKEYFDNNKDTDGYLLLLLGGLTFQRSGEIAVGHKIHFCGFKAVHQLGKRTLRPKALLDPINDTVDKQTDKYQKGRFLQNRDHRRRKNVRYSPRVERPFRDDKAV